MSKINTGGKYDSEAFKKSVGLNGVGTKAVNALSTRFEVTSFRDGKCKKAIFEKGELLEEKKGGEFEGAQRHPRPFSTRRFHFCFL